MADDLRTRIAKTLQRLYGPSLGAALEWDSEPKRIKQMYLDDADAVIRELPELQPSPYDPPAIGTISLDELRRR